ncbi:MAG: Pvc16 family protein [Nitrosomonas sp.]|uniref:Pvc16 family protein n=1 Tax=Nitrosomonas sp. TaxID=42353 RepID=UPI001E0B4A90|nr:Pvc16 family protein [Nitrosomonas sp.]MBX9895597.1 Pvc16 family protein [Nitrosomonas sp.]
MMFHYLDNTLLALLDAAPSTGSVDLIRASEKSFETPEKGNTPDQAETTINLFLYEVKENRELRQTAPNKVSSNGQAGNRRAPLRVDCAYMVTAWSKKTGENGVLESHNLLGQAFYWLSRFPEIPEQYLTDAGMTGQLFDAPTMVAQMDGAKSAGEFWSALGIPPRPYFNLIVTICMDLDQQIESPIVTTITSRYLQTGEPSSAEELLLIGGTVRDKDLNPIPDAWVRFEPSTINPSQVSEIKITDQNGRFIFSRAVRGSGFTLQARASGYPETLERSFDVVPSASGDYDLQFP